MRVNIDKEKKIILLKWLKQGYIETMDIPECYEGGNAFEELMKSLPLEDDEEE
ncbi:hypothetical protein Prede_2355 [Prevotella dentalis DSM 3688]|uniref:Uncharacterized protein n=1 Tax=Prevotella dentalis (strain ATCC 49559 / DSM 3688 / JCM 13448 / NCTC 12043 / ES 2772) TaxID=908937 RepID=F9D6I7_PREDD|nr:hypothetical protein [Prevotella dentalis]AGB29619.1 hypothetical protein Prede_2355 [Prevotella dentalis DSM 3688]EGQ11904.1 hypothetical protein HMPREF9136_2465 [Prevotella dentalis DSM 3688]